MFDAIVSQFQQQLIALDNKYPGDEKLDECIKYIEQLAIYKRFTDGLIDNSSQHLEVIGELKERIKKNDEESSSSVPNPTNDEQITQDVESLRICLEDRTALEGKAIDSLEKLESVITSLLTKNAKLWDENENLHSRIKSKSKPATFDETIAMEMIANLNQEILELKNIIERNKILKESIQSRSPRLSSENICTSRQIELEDEIKNLKRQLAEKDIHLKQMSSQENKQIKTQTNVPLNNQSIENRVNENQATRSTDADSDAEQTKSFRSKRPHRPKSHESNKEPSNRSLTDAEYSDNEKLKIFKDGAQELASILKEKYDQLRAQRSKINELMEIAKKCTKFQEDVIAMQNERDEQLNKNKKLEIELKDLKAEIEKSLAIAVKCSKFEEDLHAMQKERDDLLNKIKNLEIEEKNLEAQLNEFKAISEECQKLKKGLLAMQIERDEQLNKNKQLEIELKNLKATELKLDEMKRQSNHWNDEMDKLKDRDKYFARKLVIQEDFIDTLLCERQNLIQINNDMLTSISICKNELHKYTISQ